MSLANATVTGNTGPGKALTAQVFLDVERLEFDYRRQIIELVQSGERVTHVEYNDITTVTFSIVSGVTSVTITNV